MNGLDSLACSCVVRSRIQYRHNFLCCNLYAGRAPHTTWHLSNLNYRIRQIGNHSLVETSPSRGSLQTYAYDPEKTGAPYLVNHSDLNWVDRGWGELVAASIIVQVRDVTSAVGDWKRMVVRWRVDAGPTSIVCVRNTSKFSAEDLAQRRGQAIWKDVRGLCNVVQRHH